LHQQFLKLQPLAETREPSWEPPIDVLETDREILIFIALPGVDPNEVEAILDRGGLVVSGRRALPAEHGRLRIAGPHLARTGWAPKHHCPFGRPI
jgi:HSP20 family molecular chaperone IbpA